MTSEGKERPFFEQECKGLSVQCVNKTRTPHGFSIRRAEIEVAARASLHAKQACHHQPRPSAQKAECLDRKALRSPSPPNARGKEAVSLARSPASEGTGRISHMHCRNPSSCPRAKASVSASLTTLTWKLARLAAL